MMVLAHIFLDHEKFAIRRLHAVPRRGDILRLSNTKYTVVTEVTWCLDETVDGMQRVNIGSELEPEPTINH